VTAAAGPWSAAFPGSVSRRVGGFRVGRRRAGERRVGGFRVGRRRAGGRRHVRGRADQRHIGGRVHAGSTDDRPRPDQRVTRRGLPAHVGPCRSGPLEVDARPSQRQEACRGCRGAGGARRVGRRGGPLCSERRPGAGTGRNHLEPAADLAWRGPSREARRRRGRGRGLHDVESEPGDVDRTRHGEVDPEGPRKRGPVARGIGREPSDHQPDARHES
jgi:hypothetical protein